MSFKSQIFQTRLTFNKNNVFAKNCDVRLIIITLCVISGILPIITCAKLENPQIRLLINDDDLLQEKTNLHGAGTVAEAVQHDHSGEHFNLYRSELKRLSYETIHRILRDENEPSYRREDTELRYYQKRSPSYEENHQLIKRSTKHKDNELNLKEQNLTEFLITPELERRLHTVSVVDLSHNYISQLSIALLANITSLSVLNLQNNSFSSIPLNQQSTLRTLNLNNNLIKTSSLSANIYLRNLYLSGNLIDNLSSIQFSLLKNLESLDISHNLLKSFESSFFTQRMHNLKHLNLAFNQLGSIYRETFYNLLSLNTLLLSHNNISDIDYETFLALPNLQYLDLSFNNLQGKSIRALQGITGLVALNIAFNPNIGPYMQEFVASWSLKQLDASGTGLCQIPAALAQSVRSLKLTHNWLKVINCGDLDSYPLLQYLDLSFSQIEHVEDDALGRLEILEILMLDHNKLLKIPFSLPVSLEHLFLQYNDIMEIPQQAFQGLNNLKTLDLSHNKLLYLPDIMVPKLQTLNLQSSEIRGISQGIIHSLPKLNDLMLEDNPIKCADLLGIAEWASTCRLRVEKEGEGEEQQTAEGTEEDNVLLRLEDLKNKFEKMHNFYEQFGLNTSYINDTLLSYLKAPACVQENLNTVQQIQEKTEKHEENIEKKFKPKSALNKALREIKFNQDSATSRPLLAIKATTERSFVQHNDNRIDAEGKIRKEFKDEAAVKTITIENPTQTAAATMKSSILNEKQQTSYTNPKSFNSNATPTTAVAATTINTNVAAKILSKATVGQREIEMVGKPRFANKTKTFDHLTANANADAVTRAPTSQQDEIASIGNTPTKSSSSRTELVEAVSKRTKEAHRQLQNMQHKTTLAKTFQTTKSKKWMKQETPVKCRGREVTQNMDILLKHSNGENITAPQFIKSTTFVTSINSKIQATTKTTLAPPTLGSTAASLATTTMTEAFAQLQQDNKQDNVKAARGELKEKDVEAVSFERPTSNLKINVGTGTQQHEIKTKISTTKAIKSLATKQSKSLPTKITKAASTATTNKRIAKITLKIPPEITANLDKPNKELNEFHNPTNTTTNSLNKRVTKNALSIETTTTKTSTTNSTIDEKHKLEATASRKVAILDIFKTIEARTAVETESVETQTTTTTTTTTATTLFEDKDLASNYNDNDNNGQITKTINKTSNSLTSAATTSTTLTSSSSSTNANNQIEKIVAITTTTATSNIIDQQQHNHLFENTMSNSSPSLQNSINVNCTQSNSNECHSAATMATQRPDEIGKTPTVEVTLAQTTASKTSTTEIPEAAAASSTTPATTTVRRKHEPLQLLVKDRHLIGTPLLMHKGENLMVTADEVILPTKNSNAKQENNNSSSNNKERQDLKTNTMANDDKNRHNLEISQTANSTRAATVATRETQTNDEQKLNITTKKNDQEEVEVQDLEKNLKPNFETKTKKPSLIMKKMTIITKQHADSQRVQPAEPLENEVHAKQFDNSHYQELKPLATNVATKLSQSHVLKHNTVNTPVDGSNQDNKQSANLLKQPHTFQHEHELLIQQILQEQQTETHAKLTNSEQWSDLRKAESKENHPGLILLVSSGLFLVLLLGLMHVYRCDMPWRRHSPSHHLRPHQRQNHSLEDDSHSFLSYSEGLQKWHHSARLEAPYNSPLHNLHVRELQKISATEKATTVKSSVSNFKPTPLSHSMALDSSRSSASTTSTASASSSAIDDDSFYIEMTPDSGQFARALQSELLPMELLNIAQAQMMDYQDSVADSQTSMEDECVMHFAQQQRQLPHMTSLNSLLSASAALPCSTSSAISTTSLSVKPQAQSRKFGLW